MDARSIHRLNFALIALLLAWSALVYPRLPERIPVHFSFSGEPDGWAGRAAWFLMPATAAAVAVLVWALGRLGIRWPQLWNIPHKKLFLELSPDRRRPVVDELRRLLAWVAVWITLLFGLLQYGTYLVAAGRAARLPWYVLTTTLAFVVLVLGFALRFNRRIAQRILAAAAS